MRLLVLFSFLLLPAIASAGNLSEEIWLRFIADFPKAYSKLPVDDQRGAADAARFVEENYGTNAEIILHAGKTVSYAPKYTKAQWKKQILKSSYTGEALVHDGKKLKPVGRIFRLAEYSISHDGSSAVAIGQHIILWQPESTQGITMGKHIASESTCDLLFEAGESRPVLVRQECTNGPIQTIR